jgi:transposase
VARDWRDDRIEELERENAQLRARVDELLILMESQQKVIATQELRIQALEAKLGRTSENSSQPPSSDPPGTPPPARPPRRKGRKRGGQPGHPKHSRTLVPPEQVDRTHVLKPDACRRCFKRLAGDDPAPVRHQVIEIPKPKAFVEEFQLHALVCEGCGTSTRATLPAGVPEGQFGPRLQATVAVCSGSYKLSKRQTEELVEDFFGISIALGSVTKLEQATSEAIAAPVEEVAQAIRKSPVVHADETGWFERSKRAWLWVAVTATLALFLIRKSRGTEVAKELLGEVFAGLLVSDRWSAYTWVDVLRRQICWAHLERQFIGFQAHGPEACRIGEALELLTETMFSAWHRVRDGTMTRSAFRELMEPLRVHVVARLQEGADCSIDAISGRCREILTLEPALWTFVEIEGVEPTNNPAERIVRPGVLWRKKSFGTDSPSGSRFVERILTAVMTLRLQKRNVLDYMTAACEAYLQGKAAPSLLPP